MMGDPPRNSGSFLGAFPGVPFTLGFGELAQGIDGMRTMWTHLLNSPITPTLDLEELERRIRDLKTVEQWLAVNQNLLRTTIQGLEIQRTTIATLQAVAGAMARPLSQAPQAADTAKVAEPTTNAGQSNARGKPAAGGGSAFAPSVAPGTAPGTAPSVSSSVSPSAAPSTAPGNSPSVAPGTAPSVSPSTAPNFEADTALNLATNFPPNFAANFAPAMEAASQQAGQWWQFLHQQFRQLADSSALATQSAAGSAQTTAQEQGDASEDAFASPPHPGAPEGDALVQPGTRTADPFPRTPASPKATRASKAGKAGNASEAGRSARAATVEKTPRSAQPTPRVRRIPPGPLSTPASRSADASNSRDDAGSVMPSAVRPASPDKPRAAPEAKPAAETSAVGGKPSWRAPRDA